MRTSFYFLISDQKENAFKYKVPSRSIYPSSIILCEYSERFYEVPEKLFSQKKKNNNIVKAE